MINCLVTQIGAVTSLNTCYVDAIRWDVYN